MAAFAKAGNRLINLDNVVEIKVTQPREARHLTDEETADYDYPPDNFLPARDLSVEIVTNATSGYETGFDPDFFAVPKPYCIHLHGTEAEVFLSVVGVVQPNYSESFVSAASVYGEEL